MATNALAANPSLYQPQPFLPSRDVVPIALVGRIPVTLATSAASPLRTFQDVLNAARKRPLTVSYASPGNGSTPHLAMTLLERATGTRLLHIPYKGGAPAISDAIGGQVDTVAVNMLEVLPLARSGRVRVLAVMSRQRTPALPLVPTLSEQGLPAFEASVWYGLVAPAKTAPHRVQELHSAVQSALQRSTVRQRLKEAGGDVEPGSAEAFRLLVEQEKQRYDQVIQAHQIRID